MHFSMAVNASMKSSIGISPLFLDWHGQFVSIALPVLYQMNFHMPLLVADCREAQYQGIFLQLPNMHFKLGGLQYNFVTQLL